MKNFIVVEGLDGAGTTTQMKAVGEALKSKGHEVWLTNEPTGHDTGKLLRRCLSGEITVPGSTMAYLFAADRHEHLYGKDGICEHAQKGIVICDRYLHSSFAYQGDDDLRRLVGKLNQGFPVPELTVWLDVPPEECMRRLSARDGKKEIYENLETLKAVHNRYEAMFTGKMSWTIENARTMRIDGTLSKEQITDMIVDRILELHKTKEQSRNTYRGGR